MELNKDFKEFLELLNLRKIKYLVVGGYAVAYYGFPRYTGDIDLWVAISKKNANGIMEVLIDFGFSDIGISKKDFLEDDVVIQLGHEPFRIDLLTSVSGLNFEECYEKKVEAKYEGLKVDMIDLRSLKTNKKATGRLKDLNDLENLP
jgi:hypothetical protein